MNPILAFVLTFFIIHIGMMVAHFHFILVVIVSHDIIAATGKIWMHYDELDKEMEQRALGRFALSIYP